jgi:hypothetical protein
MEHLLFPSRCRFLAIYLDAIALYKIIMNAAMGIGSPFFPDPVGG